jgi:glycosyltransferase involved in cell wall biosynthesis
VKRLLVSVVVPVRDDADRLKRLLACLRAQTMPRERFEVIVVDDGSRAPIDVGAEGDRGAWLHTVRIEPSGSFAARNQGAGRARGVVLAFTDADCEPLPDWLDRGMQALAQADMVAGRVRPRLPARPTVWSLIELGGWQDLERIIRGGGAVTANLLVRAEWFARVGGFDAGLASGGDFDFAQRCLQAGARGIQALEVVVEHETETAPRPVLRRLWLRNLWAAIGAERRGERPDRVSPVYLIPGANLWRRRRRGLAAGFDRTVIRPDGRPVSRLTRLRAVLLRDLVVNYLIWTAQRRGRRLARAGREPGRPR